MAKNKYEAVIGTHGINGYILKEGSTIILDEAFEKSEVFKRFFKKVEAVPEADKVPEDNTDALDGALDVEDDALDIPEVTKATKKSKKGK